MTGDIRLPIVIQGYVVVRGNRTLRTEYDSTSWEFTRINRVGETDAWVMLIEQAEGEPDLRDYDANTVDLARKALEYVEPIDAPWILEPDARVIGDAIPEVR